MSSICCRLYSQRKVCGMTQPFDPATSNGESTAEQFADHHSVERNFLYNQTLATVGFAKYNFTKRLPEILSSSLTPFSIVFLLFWFICFPHSEIGKFPTMKQYLESIHFRILKIKMFRKAYFVINFYSNSTNNGTNGFLKCKVIIVPGARNFRFGLNSTAIFVINQSEEKQVEQDDQQRESRPEKCRHAPQVVTVLVQCNDMILVGGSY